MTFAKSQTELQTTVKTFRFIISVDIFFGRFRLIRNIYLVHETWYGNLFTRHFGIRYNFNFNSFFFFFGKISHCAVRCTYKYILDSISIEYF